MDGFQGRLNGSVQRKLSLALALAILAVAVVAGGLSFLSAFDEAHELQDDVLRQIVRVIERQPLAATPLGVAALADDGDEEARVIVQRLDAGDRPGQAHDGGALPLPPTLADGLHTLDVRGEAFRVLVRTTAAGDKIAVAQELDFRDAIARDGALRTVMPLLLLMPVLLLVVAVLVRRMFRPIARLSAEIDARGEQALHPVDTGHFPVEVRPFAVAINRLLARVGQAMDVQRRFVADAAHELRSPLTALSLQAERLAQAEMSETAHGRLRVLRQGIARGRDLLDQLLALARAQSTAAAPRTALSVLAIYRRVLEDLVPLAEAKRIDIGIEGGQDATVWASELDLVALVGNLVDNAIRYTPDGGRIDLAVGQADGCVALSVRDNGPGIAPEERARVFDPFYRALGSGETGSGLGLSIVRTVADRIGARIVLDYADAARATGLSVVLLMPPAPASPTTA